MQLINQSYFDKLPDAPILIIHRMARDISNWSRALIVSEGAKARSPSYSREDVYEAHVVLYDFCTQIVPKLKCPAPGQFAALDNFCNGLEVEVAEHRKQEASSRTAPLLGSLLAKAKGVKSISYAFGSDDFGKIQEHINALRRAVTESQELSDEHTFRLLQRIEKVQKELHQKMSNVDQLSMLIFDGLIVVKKLSAAGADALKEASRLAFWFNAIHKIVTHAIVDAEGLEAINLMGGSELTALAEKAEKSLDL